MRFAVLLGPGLTAEYIQPVRLRAILSYVIISNLYTRVARAHLIAQVVRHNVHTLLDWDTCISTITWGCDNNDIQHSNCNKYCHIQGRSSLEMPYASCCTTVLFMLCKLMPCHKHAVHQDIMNMTGYPELLQLGLLDEYMKRTLILKTQAVETMIIHGN